MSEIKKEKNKNTAKIRNEKSHKEKKSNIFKENKSAIAGAVYGISGNVNAYKGFKRFS